MNRFVEKLHHDIQEESLELPRKSPHFSSRAAILGMNDEEYEALLLDFPLMERSAQQKILIQIVRGYDSHAKLQEIMRGYSTSDRTTRSTPRSHQKDVHKN